MQELVKTHGTDFILRRSGLCLFVDYLERIILYIAEQSPLLYELLRRYTAVSGIRLQERKIVCLPARSDIMLTRLNLFEQARVAAGAKYLKYLGIEVRIEAKSAQYTEVKNFGYQT